MLSTAQRTQHEKWLVTLTGIPTAAGREQRVIEWIERWAAERDDLLIQRDPVGNLLVTRRDHAGTVGEPPLFITAHLDHPAFVVTQAMSPDRIELEFRGGVHDPYFEDAAIEVIDRGDQSHPAVIESHDANAKPFKRSVAKLDRPSDSIRPGDVGRWLFDERGATPVIEDGLLHAPACDDLAAVAAALAVMDEARCRKRLASVALLLTVAEEVGFIGAIGACKHQSIPSSARLICLENSRSFAESPIGGGPILRVGDRMSVFSPELTTRIGAILTDHEKANPGFRWQRRLMPGGTCEATTFSVYGYQSTCVCLPLGSYHNMHDIDGVTSGNRPARVAPEVISIEDYHGMIELLLACADGLADCPLTDNPLLARMEDLFQRFGHVITPEN
jgi:putative aminopeptidase FrvX